MYVCGTIFLVPRVALILLCILIQAVACLVIMIGADTTRPLSPTRSKLIKISLRIWPRILLVGAGFWWISEQGQSDPNAPVVISNHSSWTDILCLLCSRETPSFLSNHNVARMPLVGTIAKSVQCVFVDRSSEENRAAAAEAVRMR
jgi:1-acyl-sn-glycerol-3-phosphate acyltransferase